MCGHVCRPALVRVGRDLPLDHRAAAALHARLPEPVHHVLQVCTGSCRFLRYFILLFICLFIVCLSVLLLLSLSLSFDIIFYLCFRLFVFFFFLNLCVHRLFVVVVVVVVVSIFVFICFFAAIRRMFNTCTPNLQFAVCVNHGLHYPLDSLHHSHGNCPSYMHI